MLFILCQPLWVIHKYAIMSNKYSYIDVLCSMTSYLLVVICVSGYFNFDAIYQNLIDLNGRGFFQNIFYDSSFIVPLFVVFFLIIMFSLVNYNLAIGNDLLTKSQFLFGITAFLFTLTFFEYFKFSFLIFEKNYRISFLHTEKSFFWCLKELSFEQYASILNYVSYLVSVTVFTLATGGKSKNISPSLRVVAMSLFIFLITFNTYFISV